jgi:hypothetical protein
VGQFEKLTHCRVFGSFLRTLPLSAKPVREDQRMKIRRWIIIGVNNYIGETWGVCPGV